MKRFFRIEPVLVALVTFGPLVAAYWLYHSGHGAGLPRVENPERRLFEPPVPLPPVSAVAAGQTVENAWSGKAWSLVYLRTSPCDAGCTNDLVRLLQVHLSLGADKERFQRVYLAPEPDARILEDRTLIAGRLDGPQGEALLARLRSVDPPSEGEIGSGRIYVVDPHGLLVLAYPGDADQAGLRKDLERVIGKSRSG